MDQKPIAIQLRKLAADPDNQTYIVREKGCMKGLMGFLTSKDEAVLLISLQALQFLSSHPLNKEPLSKEPGLLVKLVGFTDHENEDVKRVAGEVLSNLEEYINGSPDETDKKKSEPFQPRFLYSVPLQIGKMSTDKDVTQVERALLAVNGVVSITVELSTKEVMVYTRTQEKDIVHLLIAAVRDCGFDAMAGQGQQETAQTTTSPATASEPLKPTATPLSAMAAGLPPLRVSAAKTPSLFSAAVVVTPSAPVAAAAPSAAPKVGYLEKKSVSNENSAANSNTGDEVPGYLQPVKTGGKGSVIRYGGLTEDVRIKKQKKKQQEKQSTVKSLFGAVTSYFW